MIPRTLEGRLRLPAIAAPMFLTSGPDLVTACCNAGIVGTFPALNQRSSEGYADWLDEVAGRLAPDAAPFGINLIVHRSNPRVEPDLKVTVDRKVPLVITSLGAVRELVDAVHGYGGLVFHDVTNIRHARKAAEAGVDGLIAVCAGAGGHAGVLSPFALVAEIRAFFAGTIVLAGAINTGAQIAAARALGADMAYIGTRFMVTREAMIPPEQKRMMIEASAADIVYTPSISGVPANFLRPSIVAAGLDPENLPPHKQMDMASEAKAWKNVWSAGQGVGGIREELPAADLIARMRAEYAAACTALAADPFR